MLIKNWGDKNKIKIFQLLLKKINKINHSYHNPKTNHKLQYLNKLQKIRTVKYIVKIKEVQ